MILVAEHKGVRTGTQSRCGARWRPASIPMDAHLLGALLVGVRCPACGGSDGIDITEARELTAAEALRL